MHVVAVAVLTAAATWCALLSWRGLLVDWPELVVPALLLATLVAAAGALGRSLRAPGPLLVLGQALLAAAFVLGTVTGSVLPTPATWAALLEALAVAAETSRSYAAPVPADVPPLHPLLLVGAAAAFVVADLLAGTLRRVPLAGLVLLVVYTLPVGIGTGVPWWVFTATTAAFLALLFVQHDAQLARWGRAAAPDEAAADPSGFGVHTGAVQGPATALGSSAIALAVVVPLLLPTLDLDVLDGTGGTGDGEIEVVDPTIDLRRNLSRGDDVPLVYVQTDDPDPSYLRISALTRFADGYWSPGDRDIPADQTPSGEMPPLQGVSTVLDRRSHRYQVRTTSDFQWSWLPTATPLRSIRAPGDWRFDSATRDFIASTDEQTAAGLEYEMTGLELTYDPDSMDAAVSGGSDVESIFTALPGTLPSDVRSLAAAVTGDEPTRFRKAVALQEWFRTQFTYDLSQVESAGRSYADLLAFLDESGRRGYCEQFAAAMAIMARTLDIPARVAVGFLQPRRVGDGVWEYSAHDLHAWPELYFPGSGWVRFEPTPSRRAGEVPAYTAGQLGSEESPGPTRSPGQAEPQLPDRGGATPEVAPPVADPEQASSFPWGTVAVVLLAVGGAVGLALVPLLVRRVRRTRRLDSGSLEEAWQELRDTAVDLGLPWPTGRSPRATGEWLAQRLGAPAGDAERPRRGRDQDPEAAGAVDRLVLGVERQRYSAVPPTVDATALRRDVERVSSALGHGVGRSTRRRATWLPRSVVGVRRPATAEETTSRAVATGGTVLESPAGDGLVDRVR